MSQVQQLGKQTIRAVKNYTKGYTDTQTMVREATSNDPWGPSGTQMSEIAEVTFDQPTFIEVMEMLDKRLNDKGKNWRHVFKSLTLLDYLLHAGSENVVLYFKENLYIVKTLREFAYVDDEGKDQGSNVRQKAKDITALLMDDERLRAARKGRAHMRERLGGGSGAYSPPPNPPSSSTSSRPRSRTTGSRPNRNEDDDLRRAIEESKRLAQMEAGRKNDEDDMARAIRLSEEEEAKRKAQLAGNQQNGLFDEQQRQQQQQQSDQLIDFNSAPLQPQQTAMMPQFTGMPTQQFSSYNPFAAQQQAAQEEYMRMLEMQRQMEQQQQQQQQQYQQMLQQQYQQQQQQQQQQYLMAQHTAAPLQPQPTAFGSNNPFAAFSQPQQQPSLQQQQQPSDVPPVPELPRPASQPPPAATASSSNKNPFPARRNENDEKHAQLAAMLGSGGSGIDTYGNVGNLRVPMGAAFHPSNLQAQQTGTNPFQRAQSQPPQQQQSSQDQPFFQL